MDRACARCEETGKDGAVHPTAPLLERRFARGSHTRYVSSIPNDDDGSTHAYRK